MRNRKDLNPSTSVSKIREARLVRKWATAWMIKAAFLVTSVTVYFKILLRKHSILIKSF